MTRKQILRSLQDHVIEEVSPQIKKLIWSALWDPEVLAVTKHAFHGEQDEVEVQVVASAVEEAFKLVMQEEDTWNVPTGFGEAAL